MSNTNVFVVYNVKTEKYLTTWGNMSDKYQYTDDMSLARFFDTPEAAVKQADIVEKFSKDVVEVLEAQFDLIGVVDR